MTDREKLVELLEAAESAVYWNSSDKNFIEKIADHLIAHGVTVREMQKPLNLEELSCETGMYWVENEDGCFPVLLWYLSYCYSAFSQFGTEQDAVMDNNDYGKTWRCWAEKPTEEERKMAKWRE